MKSYEWVTPVDEKDKIGSIRYMDQVKMTGYSNLHNTRQDLMDEGWVDNVDTEYLLPSGYIYKFVDGRFSLSNPEFDVNKGKKLV